MSPVSMATVGASSKPASGAWRPTDLGSALTVWYDASDSSTVTLSSGKVSQINDKSGNGRNATQSTAGNQPVIASAVQNSRDALKFYDDATADWLTVPSTGVTAQPYTIFSAVRFGATGSEVLFMNSSGITYQDTVTATAYVLYAGTTLAAGTSGSWAVFGGTFNGTSSSISNNGTVTTGNAGTGVISGATTRIGQRTDATTGVEFRGWLGEFLIINGTLATTNRQKLEGYLAQRWGLAGNLPSTHPYRYAAP